MIQKNKYATWRPPWKNKQKHTNSNTRRSEVSATAKIAARVVLGNLRIVALCRTLQDSSKTPQDPPALSSTLLGFPETLGTYPAFRRTHPGTLSGLPGQSLGRATLSPPQGFFRTGLFLKINIVVKNVLFLSAVCDKKITYITFSCFEFISILHNIIVALK